MIQQEMNDEKKEIRKKAFELYQEHGFKDGDEFVDWLEAEKQTGKRAKLIRYKQFRNILFTIVGILCVITAILLFMLFKNNDKIELSESSMSKLKVMMLVLDPKTDEKIIVFGDTHFDFGQSTLSLNAKTLLDNDVKILKEHSDLNVRMAGYTSAQGSDKANQILSERRANVVKDYLIEKGISPERITTIGYGRTKPALFEVEPGKINSKEAMANMRVLFEIIVKGK